MALSVLRASVRGKRRKPGPRVPTCRELTYPAPRSSVASPASDGKRNPTDPNGSVAAIASNASTLMAMRTTASPLLPGRDGDDLPPLPFASRPLVASIVAAGDEPVPRGLIADVAIGRRAGDDLLPRRTIDWLSDGRMRQRCNDDQGSHGAHGSSPEWGADAALEGDHVGVVLARYKV
jgi:hypothetical protein